MVFVPGGAGTPSCTPPALSTSVTVAEPFLIFVLSTRPMGAGNLPE